MNKQTRQIPSSPHRIIVPTLSYISPSAAQKPSTQDPEHQHARNEPLIPNGFPPTPTPCIVFVHTALQLSFQRIENISQNNTPIVPIVPEAIISMANVNRLPPSLPLSLNQPLRPTPIRDFLNHSSSSNSSKIPPFQSIPPLKLEPFAKFPSQHRKRKTQRY